MRKVFSYIPLFVTIFGLLYGAFDGRVYVYLTTHGLLAILMMALTISETLAATDVVKSNSVAHAIFDLVVYVLGKVLHKPEPLPEPPASA